MGNRVARVVTFVALAIPLSAASTAAALTNRWHASASPRGSSQQSSGTIQGELELCGGPLGSVNGCHVMTGKWSGCDNHVCTSLDEVVVQTQTGRSIARLRIRHGRFVTDVTPGKYTVALLWTSKQQKPMVAYAWHVTVHNHHTTRLVFKAYAG